MWPYCLESRGHPHLRMFGSFPVISGTTYLFPGYSWCRIYWAWSPPIWPVFSSFSAFTCCTLKTQSRRTFHIPPPGTATLSNTVWTANIMKRVIHSFSSFHGMSLECSSTMKTHDSWTDTANIITTGSCLWFQKYHHHRRCLTKTDRHQFWANRPATVWLRWRITNRIFDHRAIGTFTEWTSAE